MKLKFGDRVKDKRTNQIMTVLTNLDETKEIPNDTRIKCFWNTAKGVTEAFFYPSNLEKV